MDICYEIKIKDIVKAVRFYWKLILLVTFLFTLCGVGLGYYYASRPAPENGWGADSFERLELDDYPTFAEKISAVEQRLSEEKRLVSSLLASYPDNSSLTKLEKELSSFTSEDLYDIEFYYSYYEPLDSISSIDRTLNKLLLEKKDLEYNLYIAEEDKALLSDLGSSLNWEGNDLYKQILSSAQSIPSLKWRLEECNQKIAFLSESDSIEIRKTATELTSILTNAAESLNKYSDRLEMTAEKIAAENYVFIKFGKEVNAREPGEFSVQVVTGYHQESFSDKFFPVVLIGFLLGLMTSLFYSIYFYAKKLNKSGGKS